MYGYDWHEAPVTTEHPLADSPLAGPGPVAKDRPMQPIKSIHVRKSAKPRKRRPVRFAPLGLLHGLNAAPPFPNKSMFAMFGGMAGRAARKRIAPLEEVMMAFLVFLSEHIYPRLEAIPFTLFDHVKWIESMDKSRQWKDKLIELGKFQMVQMAYAIVRGYCSTAEQERFLSDVHVVFQKEEFYDKFDVTRIIYGLTDWMRLITGHLEKQIAAQLAHNEFTLSGIPVDQWASKLFAIMNSFNGNLLDTDFTGFEGIFWSLMKALLMWIPSLLLCSTDEEREKMLRTHWNEMRNRKATCRQFHAAFWWTFQFSGDHLTYGGNTFGHILLFLFIEYYFLGNEPVWNPIIRTDSIADRLPHDGSIAVISGDDGSTAKSHGDPFSNEQHWLKLGIVRTTESNAGMEKNLGNPVTWMNFCQMHMAPHDADVGNVIDPIKYIMRLRWIPAHLANSKLTLQLSIVKCKALSFLYKARSNPITAVVCSRLLMHPLIRKLDYRSGIDYLDAWGREITRQAVERSKECKTGFDEWGLPAHRLYIKPSSRARERIAIEFGIPIDVQVEFERNYIPDDLLYSPAVELLRPFTPKAARINWEYYVAPFGQPWTPPIPSQAKVSEMFTFLYMSGLDDWSVIEQYLARGQYL